MDNYTRLIVRAAKERIEQGFASFSTMKQLQFLNTAANIWRDIFAIEERLSYAH